MADQLTVTERVDKFVSRVRQAESSKEELLQTYNEWGATYDEDLQSKGYGAYRPPVEKLCELYPAGSRASVKILDIGAGTGLLGLELKKFGFTNIDALDPSTDMMAEAKKQGVYKNYIYEYITEKSTPGLKQDSYDVVVGSGILGIGHVPYTAIFEMLRLAKPGGYVLLSIRGDITSIPGHTELEPSMEALEKGGKWKRLAKTFYPDYWKDFKGVLYVFQVL